jgi:hypothetical protein
VLIQELSEPERLLHRFSDKYGRLVSLFYHLDRLQLVAFSLSSQKKVPEKMRDAN